MNEEQFPEYPDALGWVTIKGERFCSLHGIERISSSDVLGILTGSPENLKPSHFRISRPCYDKFHRCPGWAGGGMRYAKTRRCDNGHIKYYNEERLDRLWMWRLYRCPKCRVIVLPYMIRWVDIGWWKFKIRMWYSDWEYERSIRERHHTDSN